MKAMTSRRLFLRLKPELKTWLEDEAKRKNCSARYIAIQAIQALKKKTETRTSLIEEAMKEADKGVFISEAKMTEWVLSFGTENELPEPTPDIFPSNLSKRLNIFN